MCLSLKWSYNCGTTGVYSSVLNAANDAYICDLKILNSLCPTRSINFLRLLERKYSYFLIKATFGTTGVYVSVQYELNSKKYQQLQMFLLRNKGKSVILHQLKFYRVVFSICRSYSTNGWLLEITPIRSL